MANPHFQFKQFLIHQDLCGMKVTTDGCLFGALIEAADGDRVLDIGTGTGLLSLMLAQRTNTQIDALEIDKETAFQAGHNFKNSPWASSLKAHHTSLQDFDAARLYNVIVSNPPFFKGNALGQSERKNKAVHDELLPMEDLITKSNKLLEPNGHLWLMYPAYEMQQMTRLAEEHGFHVVRSVEVRNRAQGDIFRVINCFSKGTTRSTKSSELIIKNNDQTYTPAFIDLLKPYYLHL